MNATEGRLKSNYSTAKGKTFDKDDCELLHVQFEVTADEGIYEINTFLHTVAGADEKKYIFNDDVIEAIRYSNGQIGGIDPYPGPGTDDTTATAATDATSATDATIADNTSATTNTDATGATNPAAATGKSTPGSSTPTSNSSTVKTGSTEMALIFLVVLVMAAGVVVYTKKRKID